MSLGTYASTLRILGRKIIRQVTDFQPSKSSTMNANDEARPKKPSENDVTHAEVVSGPSQPTGLTRDRTLDKAAEFLAAVNQDLNFTYEEEKAVLRRIDCRVLPILMLAYFFQQLDKSSLAYVSIFGIVEDAHLVGSQYSWLASIIYLAQLFMQPFVAFIIVKIPTGKLLAAVIFLWGTSQAIMSACTDFASLAALRFLLGVFEAFIAPLCVAATQMWWRRSEQTLRTSFWSIAGNGVTFVVGSLLTYGLGHINSARLYSYQIIFMFCGLTTVAYSFVVLWLMPDSPMEAKFLAEREKVIATERLRSNGQGIISRRWRWDHVRETATDPKTYAWFLITIAISMPTGGIGNFGSLIIKDFGFDKFTAVLFNIPYGSLQVISTIGAAAIATKWKHKGYVISVASLFPTAGTIILLTVPRSQKGVLLFGYYLISFMSCITPLLYAWHVQNTAGDTKRKCTSAVMSLGLCAGNVIGPQLFSVDQAPEYRPGLIASVILFAFTGAMGTLITFYLMLLNKRHAAQRVALGKSAHKIDESMVGKDRLGTTKAVEAEEGRQQDATEDKGFADVTDLLNEDFQYVY